MTSAAMLRATSAFVDAFSEHDLDKVMSFFAPDAVFVGSDNVVHEGVEAIRAALAPGLPMMHFEEKDAFVDVGQGKVLTQWIVTIDLGDKTIRHDGLDLLHWRDGKIIRKSAYTKTQAPMDLVA